LQEAINTRLCVSAPQMEGIRLHAIYMKQNVFDCSGALIPLGLLATGTPERGHYPPCPFKGGTTAVQVPLHTSIKSNFMIYQDQFETIFCSYLRTHEIRMVFYNFCY